MFLCFLLVVLLFKIAPKCGTEVLSTVAKYKKVAMCHTEKICVLGKHCSGVSSHAAGHKFKADEPTI